MKNLLRNRTLRWVSAVLLIIVVAGYLFSTYTMTGRLMGLYIVGGWSAPSDVRSSCKAESYKRVSDLFTLPLDMGNDAKQGLREYWHYSYYRECLYKAGYTFLGKPLAKATLVDTAGGGLLYANPLAGASVLLPSDAKISQDNELDVTFDYRLLRTVISSETNKLMFDAYTTHEYVKSFADLHQYLDHFASNESNFISNDDRITPSGIPYLYVEDEDNRCGSIFVTPTEQIVYLYGDCGESDFINGVTDSLTFVPSVSVH